ncbi:hypothetical protein [Tritonibacter mobilis]|uniref:hypothetical protein n=1 Tax=Tritonibacter mobilis TaxID=379347 RepID=UPI0008068FE2|nr:hypothetical protein [Tritonibacter mobilis]
MRQQAAELSRDFLTLLLAGLGISLAPHEFFGGLFLALAAGSMVARHRKSNRKLLGIMSTAALAAVIAVIVTDQFDHWGWAPQLIMAGAGGASSWMVNIFVQIMDGVQERSGTIGGRIVDKIFPPTQGGDQ